MSISHHDSCPKISIVTPSYNQSQYIEETIRSVLFQNYPNIEYLIIDGGSQDGSVEIIKKYESAISFWTSEIDSGQANAINKGFSRATGEIFGYINSDDLYCPETFRKIADEFLKCKNKRQFWIAFNVENFNEIGSMGVIRPKQNNCLRDWIDYKAYLHQPGVFWARNIYESVGGFDESLMYAFDRKFFMAALLKGFKFKINHGFISTRFRYHDNSKTVQIGEINNLGFADEFIKISKWAESEASLRQKALISLARHFPIDEQKGRNTLESIIKNMHLNFFQKLNILKNALLAYPPFLKQRFFWGAVRRCFLSSESE